MSGFSYRIRGNTDMYGIKSHLRHEGSSYNMGATVTICMGATTVYHPGDATSCSVSVSSYDYKVTRSGLEDFTDLLSNTNW